LDGNACFKEQLAFKEYCATLIVKGFMMIYLINPYVTHSPGFTDKA